MESLRFCCHLSVGAVLDGVRVRDLLLLLLILLLLTHRARHHHLFREGKLANKRAVSALSLIEAVKVEESFRAADKKPEASSDNCKCADVSAAKLVQVDRGKGTSLKKRFSDSGRQISRASRESGVDVTEPTIVLIWTSSKNLSVSSATLVQPKDMNSLSVAATGKESSTGGEGERVDRGSSLQASTQLVQFCSVVARENPDDCSLFTGSCN